MELITPGTSLEDLELKIAYGLAEVAFQTGKDFTLESAGGRYLIGTEADEDLMARSLSGLFIRMLSADYTYSILPGMTGSRVTPRDLSFPLSTDFGMSDEIHKWAKSVLNMYCSAAEPGDDLRYRASADSIICNHLQVPVLSGLRDEDKEKFNKFGGRSGLLLGCSFTVSKVARRDGTNRSNLGLCGLCGWLATIGYHCGTVRFRTGQNFQNNIIVVLKPVGPINRRRYLWQKAAQKELRQDLAYGRILDSIPKRALPLILLSRFPHLAELLSDFDMAFYLMEKGQAWRTRDAASPLVEPALILIRGGKRIYNPHIASTVIRIVDLYRRKGEEAAATKLITSLMGSIYSREISEKRRNAYDFARNYIVTRNSYLAYPVIKYLMEEAMNIKSEIYENRAVRSFARSIRGFITDENSRDFWYVDTLKTAFDKGPEEAREVVEKIYNRAARQRNRLPKEKRHLPSESELAELMALCGNRPSETVAAVAMLSLCYPAGFEKEVPLTGAIAEDAPREFVDESVGRFANLLRRFALGRWDADKKEYVGGGRFHYIDRLVSAPSPAAVCDVLFSLLRQSHVAGEEIGFRPSENDLADIMSWVYDDNKRKRIVSAMALRALSEPSFRYTKSKEVGDADV